MQKLEEKLKAQAILYNIAIRTPSEREKRDHILRALPLRRDHNYRREYITQLITPEFNCLLKQFLQRLGAFQDRSFREEKLKAGGKRSKRFVAGLNEVRRAVVNKKAQCLIVAPNIQAVGPDGGLDEKLDHILTSAANTNLLTVFGLSRKAMGTTVKRKSASVIAVFDGDGADFADFTKSVRIHQILFELQEIISDYLMESDGPYSNPPKAEPTRGLIEPDLTDLHPLSRILPPLEEELKHLQLPPLAPLKRQPELEKKYSLWGRRKRIIYSVSDSPVSLVLDFGEEADTLTVEELTNHIRTQLTSNSIPCPRRLPLYLFDLLLPPSSALSSLVELGLINYCTISSLPVARV
eukprot:TRINITY_DN1158_c1_g2_i1.p1 TRINITY_DN1158_c1_g2~~TRINITY_DN1158_c1_g2_i1.p1  ORF type:complete len:352 (+),score=50.28 TRINITY_DN1158_c1_g2_i1:1126-2181(+)